MTKNITRIPICDGVTFHSIGEKRFKTGRLTAAMLLPLSAETASANRGFALSASAFLPEVIPPSRR